MLKLAPALWISSVKLCYTVFFNITKYCVKVGVVLTGRVVTPDEDGVRRRWLQRVGAANIYLHYYLHLFTLLTSRVLL